MSLIECENLFKNYGKKEAIKCIDLNVKKGKIIGLLGKNGSGKTTLIKLINGLLTPTSGIIKVDGKPIGVDSKKVISYLPERNYLDFNMKVSEVINYFKDFYADFDSERAYKLLKDLNINKDDKLNTMSKGMKEKVGLVLVMSRKAELYILDEPIGGVDPATRDYILNTILTNFENGASIIISTHLISDIERILDEVIFMNDGKIVLTENADALRKKRGKSIDEIFREEFKC